MNDALAPACMRCRDVTGKDTCFPGPCVFFHERNQPGTKAHDIATLDWIRSSSIKPPIDGPDSPTPKIYIWFADNGNIRKWSFEPFEGGTEYAPVYQPKWENPDGPQAA